MSRRPLIHPIATAPSGRLASYIAGATCRTDLDTLIADLRTLDRAPRLTFRAVRRSAALKAAETKRALREAAALPAPVVVAPTVPTETASPKRRTIPTETAFRAAYAEAIAACYRECRSSADPNRPVHIGDWFANSVHVRCRDLHPRCGLSPRYGNGKFTYVRTIRTMRVPLPCYWPATWRARVETAQT